MAKTAFARIENDQLRLSCKGVLEPAVERSLEQASDDLHRLYDQWNDIRPTADGTWPRNELHDLGRRLFDWINGGEGTLDQILEHEKSWFELRIQLEARPSRTATLFAQLPWELLAPDSAFLAESDQPRFAVVRQVLCNPPEKQIPFASARLGVLMMAPAPADQHPLESAWEENRLRKALRRIGGDFVVEDSGTLEGLGDVLRRIGRMHVVHFVSHGSAPDNDTSAAEPCLYLEDAYGRSATANAADIADTLEDHSPHLVFLSACETAQSRLHDDSLASALVARGIPAVTGWARPVHDKAATEFAEVLYGELAKGRPILQAYELARRRQTHGDDDLRDPADTAEKETTPSRLGDWHLIRLWLGPSELDFAFIDPNERTSFPISPNLAADSEVDLSTPFVGRRGEFTQKAHLTEGRPATPILVHGPALCGKSAFVRRLSDQLATHLRLDLEPDVDMDVLFGKLITYHPAARAVDEEHLGGRQPAQIDKALFRKAIRAVLNSGPREASPIFFAVDGLEQLLAPSDGEGADGTELHEKSGLPWVNPSSCETLIEVLQAFAEVPSTACRIAMTSRTDFHFSHNPDVGRLHGDDLNQAIVRLAIGPMVMWDWYRLEDLWLRILPNEIDALEYLEAVRPAAFMPGLLARSINSTFSDRLTASRQKIDSADPTLQDDDRLGPDWRRIERFSKEIDDKVEFQNLVSDLLAIRCAVPKQAVIQATSATNSSLTRWIGLGLLIVQPDGLDRRHQAVLPHPVFLGADNQTELSNPNRWVGALLNQWRLGDILNGVTEEAATVTELGLLARNSHALNEAAWIVVEDLTDAQQSSEAANIALRTIDVLDDEGISINPMLLIRAAEAFHEAKWPSHVQLALQMLRDSRPDLDSLTSVKSRRVVSLGLFIDGRHLLRQDGQASLRCFEDALLLENQIGDPQRITVVKRYVAIALAHLGKARESLGLLESLMIECASSGWLHAQAVILGDLVKVIEREPKLEGRGGRSAFDLCQERVVTARRAGDPRQHAFALIDQVRVSASRDPELALASSQAVRELASTEYFSERDGWAIISEATKVADLLSDSDIPTAAVTLRHLVVEMLRKLREPDLASKLEKMISDIEPQPSGSEDLG